MKKFVPGLIALALASTAYAKLPAPSEEAKAAAAAAKDKAVWTDKLAAYQLCAAQDKVVAYYRKTAKDAKKPSAELPACANPGPYVAAVTATQVGIADAKPVEAAGKAPPGTAGSSLTPSKK